MSFASPLFLLALIPWAAVSVWLLWGRRPRVDVPFLDLWRSAATEKHARRSMQTPPIALALVILAMLLAILAAGGPALVGLGHRRGLPVTILLDRGASMSARVAPHGDLRFRVAAAETASALERLGGPDTPVTLFDATRAQPYDTDAGAFRSLVGTLPPTGLDTREALASTVQIALRNSTGALIVLSDQSLPATNRPLVRIVPKELPENVGIVRIAARQQPQTQVMAVLRNDSSLKSAKLVIRSGSRSSEKLLALPSRGSEQAYFVDVPELGDTVDAELVGLDDGLAADNRAWLVREATNPGIEARMVLAPAIKRVVDIYRTQRPAGEGSRTITLASTVAELSTSSGIAIDSKFTSIVAVPQVQTEDHAIARSVDWASLPRQLRLAAELPAGWRPVVNASGHTLVAEREEPTRQLWIGFDTEAWSGTPSFVVFWASAFDWVGKGDASFAAHVMNDLDGDWSPDVSSKDGAGIYQRADGALRAFNVVPPLFLPAGEPDWEKRLNGVIARQRPTFPLAIPLALLSIAAIAGASASWRRRQNNSGTWSAESLQAAGSEVPA